MAAFSNLLSTGLPILNAMAGFLKSP